EALSGVIATRDSPGEISFGEPIFTVSSEARQIMPWPQSAAMVKRCRDTASRLSGARKATRREIPPRCGNSPGKIPGGSSPYRDPRDVACPIAECRRSDMKLPI
ncbi:hypothetical protein, partial [Klebsiella michiganensis]|uniref:hypothetical protein n=1 Tax=Klebsiella michiganensis TaxID=1134687 RepID=UPI00195338EA